ncbi:hypothetical protein AA309_13845 [Microvirga vignae]|uniref:DUF6456 domain-containing protein n=1 Tax=Microvirga vignae TaxID=1225564 RepID=A0A0H1RD03_9HYPH|nr:DUF6456 domain-containing protein [Microvirga vignae]KLK92736.1 hypothetical protein AA309_13845 [Microvirga vignae]
MAARSESLRREAGRLLAVLDVAGTRVMVDPTDDGSVIVHRKRAGISVGAGRFGIADAEMLVRQDLARWQHGEAAQRTLVLSEAGRSYLRRASADVPEAAFLHQHRETVTATIQTKVGLTRVRMDAEESPLDWLRRRRDRNGVPMIDEAAYQAGERLRTDITLAGLLPGVTARWDAMPTGGGFVSPSEATDRMIAARQRIRHAFDAVGSDFSDLLMDLCGFLKGLEQIERERGWPQRSAKIVVRLALARLAEHYGIEAAARGPAASRGIKSWRAVVIEGGRA